ncbi:SMP-30/gluconolactonase/LRE family protein [Simiduia sp. 21SJ11W-1]|uniref:SMP-30/gluconolactonase/LRE family protein n=1 Tax=Simiduia sp. 21SJ11W-1 TaxID=2909669 RepID=UPI0020A0C3B4|nr:SMP-30/gluconolactonase/LRE family protein [Simiduia sp. 21SJ11W-1]UTA49500.1 SMP-30/gluconolactonase/LRE family protein [Simiduia sp. 21SJ11W-1]
MRAGALLLKSVLVSLLGALAYLCFWPVPVDPVAWQAPVNQGYVDAYAPNEKLQAATPLALSLPNGPAVTGPEALVIDSRSRLYVSTHEGWILRSENFGESFTALINTQGRPLGLALDAQDRLIIADAYRGLYRYSDAAGFEALVSRVDGQALGYVNDVAVSPTGVIYFTDSSQKFPARANGGTYPASLLDIMEHGGHGRVFRYDPESKQTSLVAAGLHFANGIAIAPKAKSAVITSETPGPKDVDTLLVVETASYRIWRFRVAGGELVERTLVADNLPGFPDNIAATPAGDFWFGLVSPRSELLDKLSGQVFMRKLVQRLPAAIRPKAQHYGMVVKMDVNGRVLEQLQDPSGRFFTTTGAAETENFLFVSRLHGKTLARLNK